MGVSEAATHSKGAKAVLIKRTTRSCCQRACLEFQLGLAESKFCLVDFPSFLPQMTWWGKYMINFLVGGCFRQLGGTRGIGCNSHVDSQNQQLLTDQNQQLFLMSCFMLMHGDSYESSHFPIKYMIAFYKMRERIKCLFITGIRGLWSFNRCY